MDLMEPNHGTQLHMIYPRHRLILLALRQRCRPDWNYSPRGLKATWYTAKVIIALLTRRCGLREEEGSTFRMNEEAIHVAYFNHHEWSGLDQPCWWGESLVVNWRGWPRWGTEQEGGP